MRTRYARSNMSEIWYRGEAVEERKRPCSPIAAATIGEVLTAAGFMLVLNKLAVAAATEIAALPGRRSCLSDC